METFYILIKYTKTLSQERSSNTNLYYADSWWIQIYLIYFANR